MFGVNMLIEEKRNIRQATLLVGLAILIVILLFFYGVPLTAKFAGLFTFLGRTNKAIETENITPPAPPRFNIFPDATNKTPLEINGLVESGNTVVINFNDKEGEVLTGSDGSFSSKLNLTKGDNTLFAYTKGPTNIQSQKTKIYTILYDNEPPKITISKPADGANFYGDKQKTVTIQGTTKPDSNLTINERIVTVEDDGSFSYNYPLSTGENILNFKSIDKAGNEEKTSLKLNFSP